MKSFLAPLTFLLATSSSIAFADTTLELTSEAGDYIGQGQNYLYNDDNAVFSYSENYDNGIKVVINNLPGEEHLIWTLNLAAPGDIPLEVGNYTIAERFPFQSIDKAGLDFSGEGRGCNTLTGNFQVHEISYDDNDVLESLNVDFQQNCEGGPYSLKGTILFNTVTPTGIVAKGIEPNRVVCKNKTTGERVSAQVSGSFQDCKKLGLAVNSGDKVVITVRGFAD